MDQLTTSDKLILGGGIAYLIFMFFPWYGVDGISDGYTGWDYFLGGIIPLLLILVMAAQVIVTNFAPDTKLPDPPVPWAQVHLFAGAAAAAIVLLRTLIGSDVDFIGGDFSLDRKFGLFLALIAAIVVAAGGYLKSQEGDTASPPPATGGGAAPF